MFAATVWKSSSSSADSTMVGEVHLVRWGGERSWRMFVCLRLTVSEMVSPQAAADSSVAPVDRGPLVDCGAYQHCKS